MRDVVHDTLLGNKYMLLEASVNYLLLQNQQAWRSFLSIFSAGIFLKFSTVS
jgi:hypothetical protein